MLQILGDVPPAGTRDGAVLPKASTPAEFDAVGDAWQFNSQVRTVFVKFGHSGGITTVRL
jgi:hypothetical protein